MGLFFRLCSIGCLIASLVGVASFSSPASGDGLLEWGVAKTVVLPGNRTDSSFGTYDDDGDFMKYMRARRSPAYRRITAIYNGRQTILQLYAVPRTRFVCYEDGRQTGSEIAPEGLYSIYPLADGFLEIVVEPDSHVFRSAATIFRAGKADLTAVCDSLRDAVMEPTYYSNLLRAAVDGKSKYFSFSEAQGKVILVPEPGSAATREPRYDEADNDPVALLTEIIATALDAPVKVSQAFLVAKGAYVVFARAKSLKPRDSIWIISAEGVPKMLFDQAAMEPAHLAPLIIRIDSVSSDGQLLCATARNLMGQSLMLLIDADSGASKIVTYAVDATHFFSVGFASGSAIQFFANGYLQSFVAGQVKQVCFIGNYGGPISALDKEYAVSFPANGSTGRIQVFKLADWSICDFGEISVPVRASSVDCGSRQFAYVLDTDAGISELRVCSIVAGKIKDLTKKDIKIPESFYTDMVWDETGVPTLLGDSSYSTKGPFWWFFDGETQECGDDAKWLCPVAFEGVGITGLRIVGNFSFVSMLRGNKEPQEDIPLASWCEKNKSNDLCGSGFGCARFLTVAGKYFLADFRVGKVMALSDNSLPKAEVLFNAVSPDGLTAGVKAADGTRAILVFSRTKQEVEVAIIKDPMPGHAFYANDRLYIPTFLDSECYVMDIVK
ncbi:MAG: hypothetical protein WC712_05735 [Candidatus Brocadiia bacterium]